MKRTSTTREDIVTVPLSRPCKVSKSSSPEDGFVSDTEAGLSYLQGLLPKGKFGNGLPQIVLKHQIYSIIKDKTSVDRELMSMRNDGKLRLIKFDSNSDDYAVVTTEQYCQLITDRLGACPLRTKVIDVLLPGCVDVSVSKVQLMKELTFTDDEIRLMNIITRNNVEIVCFALRTDRVIDGVLKPLKELLQLVKQGLLLVRDVGRSAVKLMFKRAKSNELLQKDLEAKRIASSSLPVEYYIHDLIGSELVESVDTSSGPLLKLILP